MTLESASYTQNPAIDLEHERHWYVATVKPMHDGAVANGLEARGLQPFAPTYQIARSHIRADRRVMAPPLFPGYVFCRFNRIERAEVLKTPGVTAIVGFGGLPAQVPLDEIERLRALVSSGKGVQPCPFLSVGDRVRVDRGPLKGVEGLVLQIKGDWRLVVGVTLLQRSVSAIIERDVITPLPN